MVLWWKPAPGDPLQAPWGNQCLTRARGGRRCLSLHLSSSLYSVQEQLAGQIRKTQEHCHQTLFILDEAEKLHPGLLEALRPHLERQAPENPRAKSPRTIFLFLR